ncbi:MAG: hypothetical protein JSV86_03485 [Gemmatimonadota bacterium]|nr:MAG: hypothetical protein JSV86_03485 [Gemmatimonadota bacterium]
MSGSDREGLDEKGRRKFAASLGPIVEREARRVLSEGQLEGDPARLADGWERRFIADARRAEEAIELYSRLGYEVCADPVRPDELGEECDDCQLLAALQFKMIYTRKRPPTSG